MSRCKCGYHSPHLRFSYLCRDYFVQKGLLNMTQAEHEALCEVEAREFFIWLDGLCDGIGAGPAGTTHVLRIKERLDNLNMRWIDRGSRAALST